MLNIVIPMAGAGSRFAQKGYKDPKPLIPVRGKPMIQVVIENLSPKQNHRFIFICQRKHVEIYKLREKLLKWAPNSMLVEIDGLTDGAASTVLKAKLLINNNNPLMIANSDQFVDININQYLDIVAEDVLDGLIMTMTADSPKWSYVGFDNSNNVNRVVEKKVISNEATVGIYNFAQGSDFVKAAETMIINNERVNGEFYVAPVYNVLIGNGNKIGIYNIGSVGSGMHGLGTPDDLESFLNHKVSDTI
jgi:dTDP-glucose pyrophosphorylase